MDHKIFGAYEERCVPIREIDPDRGVQMRDVGMDARKAAQYADRYREGVKLPSVVLFYNETYYFRADGAHRICGARMADLEAIDAHVYKGGRREALLYAAGANADFGLDRTDETIRTSILTLLRDAEWYEWSDRAIARHVTCSHTTVAKLRRQVDEERAAAARPAAPAQPGLFDEPQELVVERDPEEPRVRKGADGRAINTAKIGSAKRQEQEEQRLRELLEQARELGAQDAAKGLRSQGELVRALGACPPGKLEVLWAAYRAALEGTRAKAPVKIFQPASEATEALRGKPIGGPPLVLSASNEVEKEDPAEDETDAEDPTEEDEALCRICGEEDCANPICVAKAAAEEGDHQAAGEALSEVDEQEEAPRVTVLSVLTGLVNNLVSDPARKGEVGAELLRLAGELGAQPTAAVANLRRAGRWKTLARALRKRWLRAEALRELEQVSERERAEARDALRRLQEDAGACGLVICEHEEEVDEEGCSRLALPNPEGPALCRRHQAAAALARPTAPQWQDAVVDVVGEPHRWESPSGDPGKAKLVPVAKPAKAARGKAKAPAAPPAAPRRDPATLTEADLPVSPGLRWEKRGALWFAEPVVLRQMSFLEAFAVGDPVVTGYGCSYRIDGTCGRSGLRVRDARPGMTTSKGGGQINDLIVLGPGVAREANPPGVKDPTAPIAIPIEDRFVVRVREEDLGPILAKPLEQWGDDWGNQTAAIKELARAALAAAMDAAAAAPAPAGLVVCEHDDGEGGCDRLCAPNPDGEALCPAHQAAQAEAAATPILTPKGKRAKATAPAALPPAEERRCEKCGCTSDQACEGGCFWVTPTLCSTCAPPKEVVAQVKEISAGQRAKHARALEIATERARKDAAGALPMQRARQSLLHVVAKEYGSMDAALCKKVWAAYQEAWERAKAAPPAPAAAPAAPTWQPASVGGAQAVHALPLGPAADGDHGRHPAALCKQRPNYKSKAGWTPRPGCALTCKGCLAATGGAP